MYSMFCNIIVLSLRDTVEIELQLAINISMYNLLSIKAGVVFNRCYAITKIPGEINILVLVIKRYFHFIRYVGNQKQAYANINGSRSVYLRNLKRKKSIRTIKKSHILCNYDSFIFQMIKNYISIQPFQSFSVSPSFYLSFEAITWFQLTVPI